MSIDESRPTPAPAKPADKKKTTTAVQSASAEMADKLVLVGRNRDKNAFASLFTYFAPRLKSYLMRLGSSPDVAEELIQDVMLLVWRKAEQYDPERAAATTWVYTIARNRRIDVLRQERRPEYDANDPLVETVEDAAGDAVVESRQNRTRLKEALEQLPEDQRKVVTMSFIEDKSHSMIAAELDLPLGTVKSRLRLAFKRFREILGDEI